MFELTPQTLAHALGRQDAPPLPGLPGVQIRLLMHGGDTGGRFSLVQHLIAPRVLGAPVHRRAREDSYTYVLSGNIGTLSNGELLNAAAGEWIQQQRGRWNALWNSGAEPASVLEIIAPAGFEKFFGDCAGIADPINEGVMSDMAVAYGAEFDWSATADVVRRNALLCY